MNKLEFISELGDRLNCLPEKELNEHLSFYEEMLNDKIEDGLSEEEAVADIGSAEEITEQIVSETPLSALVKKKIKTVRKVRWWELVLIILGSPIWLSLLISSLAVVLSLYLSLWAVIISLWSVFGSLVACAIAGVIVGIVFAVTGSLPSGFFLIASGLVCGGLSIFFFFGCKWATKGVIWLAKAFLLWIKRLFMKERSA